PSPPAVPPVAVPTPPSQQVTAPADPLLRHQQVLANLQRQSATPQPAPRPAPAPGAPPLPAAVPGPGEAPGLPGDATTAATAPPPPGMVAPASRAPSGTPALPNPAGLQKGVLGRPAPSQPTGTLPPGTVKSPGRTLGRPTPGTAQPPAPAPPPGRTLGRKEPVAPGTGKDQRSRVAGPAGVEEQFARPPASTAPPVLNNQRPTQRRPGSPAESAPTAKRAGTTDGPTLAHPDTAPPVLNRPARVPERSGPVTGKRPERGARPGGTGPAQRPGTEWVGVEAAREDATTPVLDAPAPPVGGATSKLEEVPSKLRGRRPTAARPTAARPSRGAVPPELAARQTSPGSGTPATSRAEDEPAIVTDEEAFNVETPGGGVLANRRDDTPHRPEPPTALRGN
ncbi:MAG TPA: hypothetical protein VFR67_19395, partial [Pilimelia sp.]|nr:hypothetical protein [Pilimelia sp.]